MSRISRYTTLFILFMLTVFPGFTQPAIDSLTVEYQSEPLGLDIVSPRFSWQMTGTENQRGLYQTAYQIEVSSGSAIVWNSGKISDGTSVAVPYAGDPLQARTRYAWTVTVWDQEENQHSAESWFETGLMDSQPSAAAWQNAQWIGSENPQLYSHYLSVFRINYKIQIAPGSDRAAFVLGANDTRLFDKNLNLQGISTPRNGHYIAFELDVSTLTGDTSTHAMLNVYRAGYSADDSSDQPFKSFEVPRSLISSDNRHETHQIFMDANFGYFQVFINGSAAENMVSVPDDTRGGPYARPGFNLNPVGFGNDYISFPMVGDIGFRLDSGQQAVFSEIEIRNFREPSNVVFSESHSESGYSGIFRDIEGLAIAKDGFEVSGGNNGRLILADPSSGSAPMLRSEFAVQNKTIASARVYATARGIYELSLNGRRVSENYFTPGLTQYNKTHQYQTYDVTSLLTPGDNNVLGSWLSEGWWSGNITYSGENWNFFGDRPSFRAVMYITYEDGTEEIVTTSPDTWKVFTGGPVLYGSFFQGEVYDASREARVSGWNTAGFDDSAWTAAVAVPLEGTTFPGMSFDDLALIGQIGRSPAIVKTLPAREVEEVRDNVFVYDMGQNMVGFPRIRIENGTRGDTVVLRYAEVRYPDLPDYEGNIGMVMMENIRAALTHDMYILKGGDEIIQPRFTFHGYRFLEISGIGTAVPLANVEGKVISSIHHLGSYFETSNALVNRLWENITWSLRGNFLSIPTDTPARNERMGWSGDINVFSEAATYLANVDPFLTRHMIAMRDIQREDGRFTDVAPVGGGFGGILWGSAGIVIPWEVYQQYGDLKILEDHYGSMKKYMAFLDGKVDPETGRIDEGPLGDWLSPEGSKNDNTLLWTAYHVYDLEIMKKTAELLGHPEDAVLYGKKYAERKDYFNRVYVDPETSVTVHSGHAGFMFGPPPPDYSAPQPGDPVDTQASYAIPLNFNVFNDLHREAAIENLVAAIERENLDDLGVLRPENSLMTGFIGTASLSQALSENGRDAQAYRLLQQESYPSWLYSVKNGATTIWERLNSYTIEDGFGGNNSMNSFNHYSFGAVAAWMYNHSLGIQRDPEHPGFKHFVLAPTPDPDGNMTWAQGYLDGVYGRIRSSWERAGTITVYKFTVPANTTATAILETPGEKYITEGGDKLKKADGVTVNGYDNGTITLELQSGTYEFRVEY